MNPNILSTILAGMKGLAFTIVAPIVSAWNPEAGKLIADGSAIFADGKLTADEAELGALDLIGTAKSLLPAQYHAPLDLLENFVKNDVPLIADKIAPDIIAIVKAFEVAAA